MPHAPSSHVLLMSNSNHLTYDISNLVSLITQTKPELSDVRRYHRVPPAAAQGAVWMLIPLGRCRPECRPATYLQDTQIHGRPIDSLRYACSYVISLDCVTAVRLRSRCPLASPVPSPTSIFSDLDLECVVMVGCLFCAGSAREGRDDWQT
jgi:hypothetical protein